MEYLTLVPQVVMPAGMLIFMLSWIHNVEKELRTKSSKTYSDTTFQTKPLCDQRYAEIKEDLTEIKSDVKTLLRR